MDDATRALVTDLRAHLAGSQLTPPFAKLYSQHTRLREGQPSLPHWRHEEGLARLDDALRLLQIGMLSREDPDAEDPAAVLRRAAELFEWLDHEDLELEGLPLRLLSGAAYQLAGYPIRARALLVGGRLDDALSPVFAAVVASDFVAALRHIAHYWSTRTQDPDPESDAERFARWVADETISAFAMVCAALRWGGFEDRRALAIKKLKALASMSAHLADVYSWLLTRLAADAAEDYLKGSFRERARFLGDGMSNDGVLALERYFLLSFRTGRALAWPSQIQGISQLREAGAFVIATPTGSGKTAVAELAMLQALFPRELDTAAEAPLALYLTPSRALAGEVESKLSDLCRHVQADNVAVTGLYGGTDWGPTDAWLTRTEPTILVCTYEKAEALLRFVGPLMTRRVSTVVLDEAHEVFFRGTDRDLIGGENRALRLESLAARLFEALESGGRRVIAMSAVAGDVASLGSWVSGGVEETAVESDYRSTRQLIGRLECYASGRTVIEYDLLDGAPLTFDQEDGGRQPFVPAPFPAHPSPGQWGDGPEKRLRPPLLWAATHLATASALGNRRAVLVSVAQRVGDVAQDFLTLLELWENDVPDFFHPPGDDDPAHAAWAACLAACEDYFGSESREFRLLQRGIVVHHGQMPGLLARLFVELVEQDTIPIVVATSTLSAGVNLPFETVLTASVRRGATRFSREEFANLVGRAGRPGHGTEGRTLVLLPASTARSLRPARNAYHQLIREVVRAREEVLPADGLSPLAALLRTIVTLWRRLVPDGTSDDFRAWLERVAPASPSELKSDAARAIDTLDATLLSAVAELEARTGAEASLADVEEHLERVWRRTFAHAAAEREAQLRRIFLLRGRALVSNVYPEPALRRRLYRTGVNPATAIQVLDASAQVREHLLTGGGYALWDADRRFAFVRDTVALIRRVTRFRNREQIGGVEWGDILHWWLDAASAEKVPSPAKVGNWHNFVRQEFLYRFAWGLARIFR